MRVVYVSLELDRIAGVEVSPLSIVKGSVKQGRLRCKGALDKKLECTCFVSSCPRGNRDLYSLLMVYSC